jgi:hypothetical protein
MTPLVKFGHTKVIFEGEEVARFDFPFVLPAEGYYFHDQEKGIRQKPGNIYDTVEIDELGNPVMVRVMEAILITD